MAPLTRAGRSLLRRGLDRSVRRRERQPRFAKSSMNAQRASTQAGSTAL
jgi:hypothetical protein